MRSCDRPCGFQSLCSVSPGFEAAAVDSLSRLLAGEGGEAAATVPPSLPLLLLLIALPVRERHGLWQGPPPHPPPQAGEGVKRRATATTCHAPRPPRFCRSSRLDPAIHFGDVAARTKGHAMSQTNSSGRRIVWQSVITVLSAAVLISAE